MELRTPADRLVRQAPAPNGPTVTVYFGGAGDSSDLGLVTVTVPAGAGMPPHKHGGSDVILVPTAGRVQISKGDQVIEVAVGDVALVEKHEAVSLTNPGTEEAQLIVAAGPADFVAGVRAWPEPATAGA